jgi:glycogen(starch) synthase
VRVLLATEFLYDDPTAVSAIGGLASAYAAAGHEVLVAAQRTPGSRGPARESAPWGELRRLGGAGSLGPVRDASVLAGMAAGLASFRPDLVHLHALRCFGRNRLTALWLPCAVLGARVGLTFHSWDRATGAEPAGRRPWALLPDALRRAAWVTAVCEPVLEGLRGHPDGAAAGPALVPYGWAPEELSAPPPAAPVDTGGRSFALCVARLAPYKGIDALLLAWKDVCGRFPDADLVLCGADHTAGHFQRLAALLGLGSRARFVGERGRPEVWDLLRRSLFVVLPSRYELFGMAALEGMAAGKAVLASDVGGLGPLVRGAGLLTPPAEPRALAEGLCALLGDAALRERLGRAGRERAAGYAWKAVAARYLELDAAA